MANAQYSAVIPTFNRAATLARALDSVVGQTLPPAEIIIVDDGSTDDTAGLLESLTDARLRVIAHAGNKGAAAARNTGAQAAASPWLAFLDSDDAWLPGKMARQMDVVANGGAFEACVTGYLILDERHGHSETFIPDAADIELDALAGGCRLSPGSSLVVSRSAYLQLDGLDTTLPRLEDWDWLIRYLKLYRLAAVFEPLVVVHKGSDPTYAQVKAALDRLSALHRDFWYGRSWLTGRRFDATLLIEEAAGALHDGERGRAMTLTLRAIMAYPFHPPPFYAMLARRTVSWPARTTNPGRRPVATKGHHGPES